LFNLARIWGEYEGDNPVSKAGLIKKIVQDKKKPPSVEEEALLLSRLNPNISWIFRFAANTGMRISEIINLEVDQIQERQYFEDGKVKTIEVAILNPTDTKTGEARTIPLNDDAKAAKDEALAFNAGRYKQIFLNTQGKPYVTRQAVFLAMKRACKNLGIRRITPHDLRRRFASRLVESGANLIDVRDMMGHTSFKMLEGYVTYQYIKDQSSTGNPG
jgi:integrase